MVTRLAALVGSRWRVALLLLAASGAAILLALTQPAASALAATMVVTNATSGDPGSGCTLPQALENAHSNSQSASLGCPAGDPAPTVDVITFNVPNVDVVTYGFSGCRFSPSACGTGLSIQSGGGPVLVDGYTQPGAQPNTRPLGQPTDAVIKVQFSSGDRFSPLVIKVDEPGSTIRGIAVSGQIANVQVNASDVTIEGNYLGFTANGTTSGSRATPLLTINAPNAQIGGASPGARNVIACDYESANILVKSGSTNVRIQGNIIGRDRSGNDAHCSYTDLIQVPPGILVDGAVNTLVGGIGPGEGNILAQLSTGVTVTSGTGTTIRGNLIYQNQLLPVDLGSDGTTSNDPGDADTGANNLQNFPILKTAQPVNGALHVVGTLNSTPSSTFAVELYTGPTCGESVLATTTVSTDANGDASFTVDGPPGTASSGFVAATATDSSGNTSEYSRCIQVVGQAVNVVPSRVTVAEGGPAQTFALGLNSIPSSPVTVTFAYDTSQLTVTPPSVAFATDSTALQAQQITVTAKNDTVRQGDRTLPIHLSAASADWGFNGVAIADEVVTITDDEMPPGCSPRPPVVVQTSAQNGALRVAVATSSGPGLNNALKSLTWTSLGNATVTVDGIGPAVQGQTMSVPTGVQGVTFHVQRVTAGQPATVRFTATDACGDWSTFVGGGPGAF